MRSEFTKATEGTDPDSARERFQEALSRWQAPLNAAMAATGIDPSQGRAEALDVLGAEVQSKAGTDAGAYGDGLVGFTYSIDDFYVPPKEAPPAPSFTQTTLSAPYTLGTATNGASANRNTGVLDSYNSIWVGWQQQLASVGSPFYADASVRRVRIESTVDVNYGTIVGALFGYGSGEVLINLKVLDGTQLKGSNRHNLVRTVCAVYWVASAYGSGAYMLSCEFDHSYGTPRNYAALVELNTLVGCGGLLIVSPSMAYGYATPRGINVTLIR